MTTLKLTMAAALLTMGMSQANAGDYMAADDTKESRLCVSVAQDSKIGLHVKVRDYRSGMTNSNFKFIANNLYCNGENVVDFARNAGNDAIAEKLSKLRKGDVDIRDIAMLNSGHVVVAQK